VSRHKPNHAWGIGLSRTLLYERFFAIAVRQSRTQDNDILKGFDKRNFNKTMGWH
jgi:hypothetical protein